MSPEQLLERQPGFSPEAYRAYTDWFRAGDRSGHAAYTLARRAWQIGAREEAAARTEGCAPAALEVIDLVDSFGQIPALASHDQAHFAGIAAQIYFAGAPLRRRLSLAWRLIRPARMTRCGLRPGGGR